MLRIKRLLKKANRLNEYDDLCEAIIGIKFYCEMFYELGQEHRRNGLAKMSINGLVYWKIRELSKEQKIEINETSKMCYIAYSRGYAGRELSVRLEE